MRIDVVAAGKLREKPVKELVENYSRRLPAGVKLNWIEVPAVKRGKDPDPARDKEGDRIIAALPPRAYSIALTETGRMMDSREFARWMGERRDAGQDLCFIIGGADGMAKKVYKRADAALSLSALTFPHEMVRAILAEQIYRAFDILAGGPYHKD